LAWKIEFEQDAIRQLNRLDRSVRRRIVEYLELRVVASGDLAISVSLCAVRRQASGHIG
jgi:hypothetical protein